jgi:hypothetical protein
MPMLPHHAGALEELQRIVFPAFAFAERLRAEHYLAHLQVFPEGQFVLTKGDYWSIAAPGRRMRSVRAIP